MPEQVKGEQWRCPGCGVAKFPEDYYRAAGSRGRMRICKACHIARVVRRQSERYSQEAAYRETKIRSVVGRQAKRYASDKAFRKRTIEKVVRRQAKRYTTDGGYRKRTIDKVVKRQATRYAEDPKYAISQSMSAAIRESVRNRKAGNHWEALVGYTVADLMAHLESRFAPGMSWGNFGKWHIDHIIPRSAFDFATPSDPTFKECWSLGNLQPLWARDNIAKSDLLSNGSRARRKSAS